AVTRTSQGDRRGARRARRRCPTVRKDALGCVPGGEMQRGVLPRKEGDSGKPAAGRVLRRRKRARPGEPSFDHPISTQHEPSGNVMADHLRCLEVDHQLEIGWLLDWKVGWMGPTKFLDDHPCPLPPDLSKTRAVAHEPAAFGCF